MRTAWSPILFFKVTFPQLANRINWRNHRKIVVIDDEIGYIGGMNIADRYEKGTSEGMAWRDTHFRLKGDISGPMSSYNNIALCFQKAISSATKSIYIQTPYFLPTDGLLHAKAMIVDESFNSRITILLPSRYQAFHKFFVTLQTEKLQPLHHILVKIRSVKIGNLRNF